VLWLKGDAGLKTNDTAGHVTEWDDQSGNFNHARQKVAARQPLSSQNELGNSPVVRFDGTDDFLEVFDSPSLKILGDITTFFVVKMDDFAGYRAVWAKTGGSGGNYPAPWDYYLPPTAGTPNLLYGGPGTVLGSLGGTSPLPLDRYAIVGFDRSGSTANHYLDGDVNGSGTINGTGTDGGASLMVGTRGDLFTKLKGGLAELVIYNRALTEQERGTVTNYLQGKWFGGSQVGPTITATPGAGNTLVFSWPSADAGYTLESTSQLGTGAQWNAVTEPVIPNGNQNTVTVPTTGNARFFRLQKP